MNTIFAKAYNQLWVENIHNQAVIKSWFFQEKISQTQFEAAKNEFPVGFKHTNIFVKIGLFIFTNILIFSAGAIGSLFFAALLDSSITLGFLSLIYGIILFVVLNNLISKNKFYRSGVDNALIYAMLSCFFGFFLAVTDFKLPVWCYCLMLLLILGFALMKYADQLVTICFYCTWIFFWFNISSKFTFGKLVLPFIIMIISAISYFFVKYWRKRIPNNYYLDSQNILEILTLITFYIGGNYYVVREGNAMLNGLEESIQITFAPLFYFFTIGIPLFYIVWGLKKHDRKMLITGLLVVGFSIFTYREYFSSLPVELALTIGGLLLIIAAVWAISFLKTPKLGLTYIAGSGNRFQNLEAIVMNQIVPTAAPPEGTKFGGGDFGGAGAGGDY